MVFGHHTPRPEAGQPAPGVIIPTMTNREQATTFRRLHAEGELLILPNAWDAGSARIIESCGARAIATSSAALAWANGYPDGNAIPPQLVTRIIEAIEHGLKR